MGRSGEKVQEVVQEAISLLSLFGAAKVSFKNLEKAADIGSLYEQSRLQDESISMIFMGI